MRGRFRERGGGAQRSMSLHSTIHGGRHRHVKDKSQEDERSLTVFNLGQLTGQLSNHHAIARSCGPMQPPKLELLRIRTLLG